MSVSKVAATPAASMVEALSVRVKVALLLLKNFQDTGQDLAVEEGKKVIGQLENCPGQEKKSRSLERNYEMDGCPRG